MPRQKARNHASGRSTLGLGAAEDQHRDRRGLRVTPELALTSVVDMQPVGPTRRASRWAHVVGLGEGTPLLLEVDDALGDQRAALGTERRRTIEAW